MRRGSTSRWKQSVFDRFWSKVDIGFLGECWEWQASRDAKWGYGHFGLGGATARAHRVAWSLTFGEITDGLFVCHRCDNPPCVNPLHLFLGTPKANSHDCFRKGRNPSPIARPGELHPRARVTWDQVRQIRSLADEGIPIAEIVRHFPINYQGVKSIVIGRTWRRLPDYGLPPVPPIGASHWDIYPREGTHADFVGSYAVVG